MAVKSPCTSRVKVVPVVKEDPAGLDKLLLAFGRATHNFIQGEAAKAGIKFDVWAGKDGLEETLKAVIKNRKVPNKRFSEIVTPRSIAELAGVLKPKRRIQR